MNSMTEQEQNEEAESSCTYFKEILCDRKTYQKIISKSKKIDPCQVFWENLRRDIQMEEYSIF